MREYVWVCRGYILGFWGMICLLTFSDISNVVGCFCKKNR